MEEKVICRSCGAQFDASLVRCPFCGTGYAPAEEEEYMGKLEDVRKDLQRQPDDGDMRIKKGMGHAARIILIVVSVIFLLIFGLLWLSARNERSHSDRQKEEFLQDQGITTQQEDTDK